MGVSRLTAWTIQNPENDIRWNASGPVDGKYAGWILMYKEGSYHFDLLSTGLVYESAEAAKAAMKALVSEIRSMEVV